MRVGTAVDVTRPSIVKVEIPAAGTYGLGNLDFTVTFDEPVTVSGVSFISVFIKYVAGSGSFDLPELAYYHSGSPGTVLTFRASIFGGFMDPDGIELKSKLESFGSTKPKIQDAAGNDANLGFTVPDTSGVLIDTYSPSIDAVTPPADKTYRIGETLSFTVTFDEAVTVTGTPHLPLVIGKANANAAFVSGSGTSALVFTYTVQTGETDADGIGLNASLTLNGGSILDSTANAAALSFSAPSTTGVLVDGIAPSVASVAPPTDRTYGAAENLDFTVHYSESVIVETGGGRPSLSLTVGAEARAADYVSGGGSSALLFRYTVASGETDLDGIAFASSAIELNSGTIKDDVGNDAGLTFSAPTVSGVLVDGSGVSISAVTPPSSGSYRANRNLDFSVIFSKAVTVTGTPRLSLTIGSTSRTAEFVSGSTTKTLLFRHTVQAGDTDTDGIALASPVDLNGATIQDGNATDATLTFTPPDTSGVLVDTTAPHLSSVSAPSNATYATGVNLDFTAAFSESVTVDTTGGTPSIGLTIGSSAKTASYTSGNGTANLVFRYTTQSGDADSDGIASVSPISLNGGTVVDAAGNEAALSFSPPDTSAVLVDAVAPTISSVSPPDNGGYKEAVNLDFVVNYNEPVTVTGTPTIGVTIGSTARSGAYISGSGTSALVFRYAVQAGETDSDGIASASPVGLNSGTIKDAVGNDAGLTFTPPTTTAVLVDTTAPTVTSIARQSPSATSTDVSSVIWRVNFSESVSGVDLSDFELNKTDTANGAIASVSAGSGTTIDVTVDNVTVTGTLRLDLKSSGTGIADAAGNAINGGFTTGETYSVVSDATAPTVTSIERLSPETETTAAVTVIWRVTFSESVSGVDTADFELTKTSTATGTIASVSASSGTSTDVTVNSIGGNGTLRLDLKSSGTAIVDGASNENSSGFTSGEVYTIDTTVTLPISVNYDNATTSGVAANGWLIEGDATVTSDKLRLTEAVNNQKGTAIYNRAFSSTSGINVQFDYFMGNGNGADGLSFFLLDGSVANPTSGGLGGSFGYIYRLTSEVGASKGYLGLAFDLGGFFLNTSELHDGLGAGAQANRISIRGPGTVDNSVRANAEYDYVTDSATSFTVAGSRKVNLTIKADGTATLAISTDSGATYTSIYSDFNFAGTSAYTGYTQPSTFKLGFAGVTGGLNNEHTIDNLFVAVPVDLAVAFTASPSGTQLVGGAVSYTVTVTNNGPNTDSAAEFNYTVPSGITGVSWSYSISGGGATGSGTGNAIAASLNLASGAVATFTVSGTVAPSGAGQTLTHTASASASGNVGDSVPTNNSASVTTTVNSDGTAPTISSVSGPSNGAYRAGQDLDFTVNFSESVDVNLSGGSPTLGFTLGSASVTALYLSGSGSTALKFRYTVQAGETDTDGIAVASPLVLNSSTIKDGVGNAMTDLTFTIPDTTGVLVDTTAPSISGVTGPANGTYVAGQNLDFTATFSEAITVVTSGGTPSIDGVVGSVLREAAYVSGSGSTQLVFRYATQVGDADIDGIVSLSPIQLNGGTLQDAAGNDSALTFAAPTTTGVLVDSTAPSIAKMLAPSDGRYREGQVLELTANFDENVTVAGGTPTLALTIGSTSQSAAYVSGSGSSALVLRYTIQAGENDSDGIAVVSPMALIGATIKDAAGNDATLTFTAPTTTGVLVDNTAPAISSVAVPSNGSYRASQSLDFTVTVDESVTVAGTPRLSLTIGTASRNADYVSGSGTTALVFRHVVQAGDTDTDGIAVVSPVSLNSGTIKDSAGNEVGLTFTAPDTSGVLIDTTAPMLASVSGPSAGNYKEGQTLDFTATMSENVTVTGAPAFGLTIGSTARTADYVSGSGTSSLLFRYTIVSGDNDSDGILAASPLSLNSASIVDAAGNSVALDFTPPDTASVFVDTQAPSIASVEGPENGTYRAGQELRFTVRFSESVSAGTTGGTPALTLTIGSTTQSASLSSSTGTTVVFVYTPQDGDSDSDGIALATAITLNGGTIQDGAGNDSGLTFTALDLSGVLIDTAVPTITNVAPPANGTYITGQALEFTVTLSESVEVNTVGDTPSLPVTIGATARNATYQSGSGSAALVFAVAVQSGDSDSDGIDLVSPLVLNSGTIKDGAGNDATLSFTVPSTSGVLVDAVAPTIASVTPPANGSYRAGQNLDFTVNTSENVTVTATGGTPYLSLTLGSASRRANYLSGSGTSALLFRYAVQNGDTDSDGIALGTSVALNGGTLKDAAGNEVSLDFTAPSTSAVLVDTTRPQIASIRRHNPSFAATGASSVTWRVTFSESVSGIDVSDFELAKTAEGSLSSVSSASGASVDVTVNAISGTGRIRLDLKGTGTGIVDVAGNPIVDGTVAGDDFQIDPSPVYVQDGFGFSGLLVANPLDLTVSLEAFQTWPSGFAKGAAAFFGGVFDGRRVWLIPNSADRLIQIDPADGGMTGFSNWPAGFTKGDQAFAGAVFDGQSIWLVPANADRVIRLDPETGSMTGFGDWPVGFDKGDRAFSGGVFDGQNVWLVPEDADRVIKIDSATGTMTGFDTWPTGFTKGSGAFRGGLFDGTNLWLIPSNADRMIQLNPADGSMIGFNAWPAGFSKGDNAFAGGVFDGVSLWLIPRDADRVIKIDKVSGEMAGFDQWPAGFSKGTSAFAGGAFDGQSIWLAPENADRVVRVDKNTGGMTGYDAWPAGFTKTDAAFAGAVFDGQDSIWMVPRDADRVVRVTGPDVTAPTLLELTAPQDGTYGVGAELEFQAVFDEPMEVDVTDGTPQVLVTIGDTALTAEFVEGQGESTLKFRHTVANPESDSDGVVVTADSIALNSGKIRDLSQNDAGVTFTVPETTGVLVDTTAPSIASINRLSPTGADVGAGSVVFRAAFSENVSGVDTGDFELSATGTASGKIASVTTASDGAMNVSVISISGNGTLGLNLKAVRTGIEDGANNGISGGFTGGEIYNVDTIAPTIASVEAPQDGVYRAGASLDFTVRWSEAVRVGTAGGPPALVFAVGSATRNARLVDGNGTDTLMFRYTVQTGDNDGDGIVIYSSISLEGATIRDTANNDAQLTFSVPNTVGVWVDTTVPNASVISAITSDTGSSSIDRITSDATLLLIGTAEASTTVTVRRTDIGDLGTAAVDGSGSWSFDYTGTTLTNALYFFRATAVDGAGNAGPGSASYRVTVDTIAPDAPSVPDLVDANDLGSSNTDNFTSVATPVFSGTAEPESVIQLFRAGGTQLGQVTAAADGSWSITSGALGDGAHSITATSTDTAGNASPTSEAVVVTIDTGAPTITQFTDQSINEDGSTQAIAFTVKDSVTPAADLVVSADGIPPLFSEQSFVFGGSGENRTVTVTPVADQFGFDIVLVTVEDLFGNIASETMLLDVASVNDAPSLEVPADQTIDEDPGTQILTLSGITPGADNEFDAVSISVASSNTGLIPDPILGYSDPNTSGSLTFTPTANAFGSTVITLIMTDDGGEENGGVNASTNTFTIDVTSVNDAPILATIGDVSVLEGGSVGFTAVASDVETPGSLTFSLDGGAPSGASIDSGTGQFNWTTGESDGPNSFPITVRVTDVGTPNESAAQTFTIAVSEVNIEPNLAAVVDQFINEGETLNLVLGANDNDLPANALTYGFVSGPAGMAVDPASGLVSWPTGEGDGPGTYPVTVKVTDNGAPGLSSVRNFQVNVAEANNAPVLASISDQTVKENETLTLQFSASDSDLPNNALTFALSGDAPEGTIVDPVNGQFAWTPNEAQGPGTYTITVAVQDNALFPLSASQSFQVTVEEVNQAPFLPSFGGILAEEGEQNVIVLVAFDSDEPAQTITWTLGADAPSGVTLDSSVPALRWTPTETQGPGIYSFAVEAADDGEPVEKVSATVTIAVVEANQAPMFGAAGPQTVTEGQTVIVNLSATDADLPAQQLTYSLEAGAPTGAAVNANNGQFAWTPVEADGPGSYTITVLATDNGTPPAVGSVDFRIDVTEGNLPPVLAQSAPQTVKEGELLNVVVAASDADRPNQTLTYALGATTLTGASIDSASGLLSWTPTEEQGPGLFEIPIEVSDDGFPPLQGAGSMSVEVGEVNSAPVLEAVADQVVVEGESLNLNLSATDSDIPSNNLAFSLGSGPAGMSVDAASAVVNWTPEKTEAGKSSAVTVVVSDDGTPVLQNEVSFTVSVSGVNDAPVLAGPTEAQLSEDTLGTIAGVSVSDLDAGDATVEVSLSVVSGQLSVGVVDGVTVSGGNSGQLTMSGSVAGLNQALGSLGYQGESNFFGEDTLAVAANDLGNTGEGGPLSAQFSVPLTIAPMNDAPTIGGVSNQTTSDGILVGPIAFTVDDVDNAPEALAVSGSSSNTGLISPEGITLDGTGVNRTVSLQPVPGQVGTATISLEVTDSENATGSISFDVVVEPSAPVIVSELISPAVLAGGSLTLEGTAVGTPPLSYQWFFDSAPLDGATSSTLDLADVQIIQAGVYALEVSNSGGSVRKEIAQVSVNAELGITTEPVDLTVIEGETATFQVTAGGTAPFTYQWSFEGAAISGEISDTLMLSSVQEVQAGSYAVEISNAAGTVSSRAARLEVLVPPTLGEQPADQLVSTGTLVTLSVSANGTAPLSYQWIFSGNAISGATASSLVLENVQTSQSGAYQVVVRNAAGEVVSGEAVLTVSQPLEITGQPQSQTIVEGESTTLTVEVSGSEPVSYQWFYNGTVLAGETGAALSLSGVTTTQAGEYSVEVANAVSRIQSTAAILTVAVAPVINLQPTESTVVEGGSAQFSVGVSGSKPLSYQWQKNGTDIGRATDSSLSLSSVTVAEEGTYGVRVSNAAGTVESQAAQLTVNVPVKSEGGPHDVIVGVGDPLALTVSASGTPPLSYEWYVNGTIIDGANETSFSIAAAQLSDAGRYSVVIRNAVGATAGPVFNVTVIDGVRIVSDPQNIDAKKGDEVQMSVTVEGTGPFNFEWEFNGAVFRETSKPELILPGVQLNAAGNYRARVSNLVSEAVSGEAVLKVTGQAQLSGLPSLVRVEIGDDLVLKVTAVGTPPFAYQWQLNGVNIDGAVTDTYRIPNVQPPDGGTYTVTVTDAGGATTSELTSVIVITPDLGLADDVGSASPTSALSGDGSGNNVGAGSESGEPSHAGGRPAKRSVWMAWDSPGIGIGSFSTRGSGFDTILAVYKGSPGNLEQVTSDEDGGGFLTSATSFNTEAGVIYYVAVDGFEGAQGAVALRWDWIQTSEPLPVITVQPESQTVLLGQPVEFTVVAESPSANTLFYQWYLDGEMVIGANGTTLSLASAAALDVGTYRVEVSNAGGTVKSTEAVLQINLIATGSEGPGIDAVDKVGSSSQTGEQIVVGPAAVGGGDNSIIRRNARPIVRRSLLQGTNGEKLFSSKSAVKDAGEPNHCRVLGGASTWFIYEPPQSGALRVSTEGSSYDTVLAAYLSPTLDVDYSKLQEVKCNDNGGSDGQTSVMELSVEAGTRYYLVIDGINGAKGLVHFTYGFSQAPVLSNPTWFGVDPASGLVDESQENPVVGIGSSVEFRVGIGGLPSTASASYQWRRNGIDVTGGTGARLLLNDMSPTDSGNYSVEVTTFAGTVESQQTRFTVAKAIQLLVSPDNQTVVAGRSAYFAVVPFGAGPFEYQWSLNGEPLNGLTTSAVVLTDVQPDGAGAYEVSITDGVSQKSASAILTVQEALLILTQPVSGTVVAGENLQLLVAAQGVEPLSYQWQRNGVDIGGATAAALEITDVQVNQAGDYTVVVSNAFGTVSSEPAVVTVRVTLSIVEQPASQAVAEGDRAEFAVSAVGTGTLNYQWQFNGQDLSGATNASHAIDNVQENQAGNYRVVVADTDGSLMSAEAILTVLIGPSIVEQPVGASITAGEPITLRVAAAGSDPLQYQWQLEGVVIAGATNAVYEIESADENHAGSYKILVQNSVSSVLSEPAVVTVEDDSVILRIVSVSRLGDLTAKLLLEGPIGGRGIVEVSDDLDEWKILATLTVPSRRFTHIDTEAQTRDARFYRVLRIVQLLGLIPGAGDVVALETDAGEGVNVEVQTTEDFEQWTALGTVRVRGGEVTFDDPNASGKTVQFYRLLVVP